MHSIPYIVEETPRGERAYDIYSRLLKGRIVFLGSAIDAEVANVITAQLLYLEAEDPTRDISLYVNSPGGETSAGLAIYDTMQYITSTGKCRITTICYGLAASFGAVLLAGGTKGMRYALPNATILIHQPWSQQSGARQASDIEIEARKILRVRARLNDILSKHTGQPLERIQRDTDRDFYMTAEQAQEYGIIDEVISNPPAELEQAAG